MTSQPSERQTAILTAELEKTLESFTPSRESPHPVLVQKAVHVARAMQQRASELQTPQERRQQAELDRMIHEPGDKVTLVQMTDRAFRSRVPERMVEQLVHILDVQGVPRFFGAMDRTMLRGFQSFGSYLPGVAAPLVKEKMQKETANVILPAEADMLVPHLRQRREEGVRMNINYLGEALLGEEEAESRLNRYLEALQLPETEVISVKISTIYSQISQIARKHTIESICDRLELLYRDAANRTFEHADGTRVPKFVYLDMEEYRDLEITAEVFMRTLERKGLEDVGAGIALQAYIPDSLRVQRRLLEWAHRRRAAGGAPVTVRIVKGANMEAERVEASLAGLPQAPFQRKVETDANYKRMLELGMEGHNLDALRLGIASHNLFDLAYGLVLAQERGALDRVQFEMLEGMANSQRRTLFELTRNVLLYAPACRHEDFIHAIGYLIRRLDENTGPENFLRHAFHIEVGSPTWKRLEKGFLDSFRHAETLDDAPRRKQDRRQPPSPPENLDPDWRKFVNEPHTDFSLGQNVEWASAILADWRPRHGERALQVPLVIDGEEIYEDRAERKSLDPSRPGVVVAVYRQGRRDDVERAVRCARDDADGWRSRSSAERSEILRQVAHQIRQSREALMGIALAEGGKHFTESDPEVSEAVDFVEFYRRTADDLHARQSLRGRPRGVAVVVSPWNFPIAIPCGGVASSLAAGNTVILKPASDTVAVAHELCQCFWRGGVPRRALQFLPCSGASEGQELVADPGVDVVILTGGTDTARQMLRRRPQMELLAETGGKNATVVTALADRDQAIKHVLQSAFSHSGQKCSATSLLLLEEEVYEDDSFRASLCDAVESLHVGSAWELHTRVGPLIRPPSGALEKALKELEPGESWAVRPHRDEDNPHLWSPAVKWGVVAGSFTHRIELFGPVVGVVKFKNLDEAIDIVNGTGYGLTSGLESLDEREQEIWRDHVLAGNLYINRSTIGAIVLRQPFGGMRKSSFGPGIKAGGPNYVAQLIDFEDGTVPEGDSKLADPLLEDLRGRLEALRASPGEFSVDAVEDVLAALGSYHLEYRREFAGTHDHFRLIGQDNLRRYLPVQQIRVRVHPDDSFFEILARVAAARTAGCRVNVSFPHAAADLAPVRHLEEATHSWAAAIEFVEESDEELVERIRAQQTERLRFARPERVPPEVREAVVETDIHIADAPVLKDGRVELLWYLREQSICADYHRYGNLGDRADEERAETL